MPNDEFWDQAAEGRANYTLCHSLFRDLHIIREKNPFNFRYSGSETSEIMAKMWHYYAG